jgi:hypothetical protein
MLTRESYVKHSSLMLVRGNVGRVTKLGVVIWGKWARFGRGSNITLQNHNSPIGNSPFSHTRCELPERSRSLRIEPATTSALTASPLVFVFP